MENTKKTFAKNLKDRRTSLNLTQKQLASLIGYSDKAISKWENGDAIAPSEILPIIAQQLGTTIDGLLTQQNYQKYYLGIDGGASKTEFTLVDRNDNIVESVTLGSSNPVDIGLSNALGTIGEGIRCVCKNIYYSQISVFAGISGGITGNNKKEIYSFLAKFGFEKVQNGSDAQNAVASCLGKNDGIAVICGTGNIVFSQKNGELIRTGGHGYLFEDSISGYVLGREAIKAALCQQEQSGRETIITELIKQKIKCDNVLSKLNDFYNGGKKEIASFAPIVFEAYRKGDGVAIDIVKNATENVAKLINTATKNFDKPCPVVLTGGVTTSGEDIILPLLDSCNINATISHNPQINGAIMLAKENQNEKN